MTNPYYTHREYLENELKKLIESKNNIQCLEFGTGEGSAEVFHQFANSYDNIQITAYETDSVWLNSTKEKYERPNYNFHYIEDWFDFLKSFKSNVIYDLVFVDQTPWEARIETIDTVANFSKIIMLHDYDYFNKGIFEDIYSVSKGSFFYQKYNEQFELINYYDMLPPTLIMYNKKFI